VVEVEVPRIVVACVDQQGSDSDLTRDADGPSQCVDEKTAPEAGTLLAYIDRQACQQQAGNLRWHTTLHDSLGGGSLRDAAGGQCVVADDALATGCDVR